MSSNAQLFAGTVYVSFEVSEGVFGAAVKVETDMLKITTPSDKKQKLSKSREAYGQAHSTAFVAKPNEFEIKFTEIGRKLLAVQLSGVLDTLTVAGGAFTDLPLVAALDAWVDIGRKNIAEADLAIKNTAGTTTYVKDVDYEINYRLGKLRAIPGGAITDALALEATGTAQATTGTRITGGKKYRHVLRLEMDGLNLVTNEDAEFLAQRAVVTSDQAFDFLQSDIADLTLKGTLEIPGPGLPPFVVEHRKAS